MCAHDADAVLLFDYAGRHVVLDELAAASDPNLLELCGVHAERFRPPQGWSMEDRRVVDVTDRDTARADAAV